MLIGKFSTLLTIISLSAFIILGISCGGSEGGSNPSLIIITDGSSTEVVDGATAVNPTFFNLIFSSDVDATICSADDVTVSCVYEDNTALTPTFTVAVSEENSKACLVTVTDPWKYALMTCTMTYGSAASTAISTKATTSESVSFTNACAINDDYNADSSSCYEVGTGSSFTGNALSSWNDVLGNGILAFDTANSALDYSLPSGWVILTILKPVTSIDSDFGLTIHIKNAASFGVAESAGLALSNGEAVESLDYRFIEIGVGQFDGVEVSCFVAYDAGAGYKSTSADCTAQQDDLSVKLVATATDLSLQYWNGTDYVDFPAGSGLPSTGLEIMTALGYPGDTAYLGMIFVEAGPPSSSAEIHSIEATGVNVDSQY